MKRLRRKLDDDADNRGYILTAPCVGYHKAKGKGRNGRGRERLGDVVHYITVARLLESSHEDARGTHRTPSCVLS